MRIAVWPGDDGGCGHYRMTWPAQALADQGADIDLLPPSVDAGGKVLLQEVDGITRCIAYIEPPDADVVVIQRPLAARRADAIPLLQTHGIRVVVEIDDDFQTIHPRNSSWRSTHPRLSPGWNRHHLARACRAADLVTVTTPALAAQYGKHGRVAVVPNCVPESYLRIVQQERKVVGWTGSTDTHPTDLQVTRGAVARCGWPVEVVGTGVGVQDALNLARPPEATGWLELADYPYAMAQHGVGIVPLDDIAFNHGKSALKMMEYAALGVPVVASPTADNARMNAHGVGLLAAKPKHWAAHLRRLLASPAERDALAGQGRDAMMAWTIEGNADRWWDAWSSALDRKVAA